MTPRPSTTPARDLTLYELLGTRAGNEAAGETRLTKNKNKSKTKCPSSIHWQST